MGMRRDGTPGSAGLYLAAGVPLLHPDEQVFAAMLAGWRAQQLARNLALATIGRREAMVRSFAAHADAMPWQWGPGMLDEWLGDLRGAAAVDGPVVCLVGVGVLLVCDRSGVWVGGAVPGPVRQPSGAGGS